MREGKSNKGREVPLNASARRALRAYLQLRPKAQPDDPCSSVIVSAPFPRVRFKRFFDAWHGGPRSRECE